MLQGHRDARKQKFLYQLSQNVYNQLNGSWYAIENCWFDKPHIHFILSILYSRERTQLIWFCFKKKQNFGLQSNSYRSISFKFGMIIGTAKLCILISLWISLITFILGHCCIRKQKLWRPLSHEFKYQFG